jgi:protein-L-isoaspartate O-methyltransferase
MPVAGRRADSAGWSRAVDDSLYNTTCDLADLDKPAVREAARALTRCARRLFVRNTPFAVNGVLRRRFYVRRHKLWEYARGLAYGDVRPPMRVLDFGGGATLPVFYLAEQGCDVTTVDVNRRFVDYTNDYAARRGGRLMASSVDLCVEPAPSAWAPFDRILSFCVLEHLPAERQAGVMKTLAGLLRPGGIMALTFDFGRDAPSEWPLRTMADVEQVIAATGLTLLGNRTFHDTGQRFTLDKRHPEAKFTIGSLFLTA